MGGGTSKTWCIFCRPSLGCRLLLIISSNLRLFCSWWNPNVLIRWRSFNYELSSQEASGSMAFPRIMMRKGRIFASIPELREIWRYTFGYLEEPSNLSACLDPSNLLPQTAHSSFRFLPLRYHSVSCWPSQKPFLCKIVLFLLVCTYSSISSHQPNP